MQVLFLCILKKFYKYLFYETHINGLWNCMLYEILKLLKLSVWCHLHPLCVPKINGNLYWLWQLKLIKILRISDNRSSFSTAGNLFPRTNNISVEIWHLYSYHEKNELTVTDRVSVTLSHMSLADFLLTNSRYAYFKEPRYSLLFSGRTLRISLDLVLNIQMYSSDFNRGIRENLDITEKHFSYCQYHQLFSLN